MNTQKQLRLSQRILNWVQDTDRTALIGLIIANLLPLVLCLIFGWKITSLVMFYWVENLIIGLYAIARILWASGSLVTKEGSAKPMKAGQAPLAGRIFLACFFTVHYYGFCFVHGIFLLLATSFETAGGHTALHFSPFDENILIQFWKSLPTGATLSIVALLVSHGISFYRNYLLGEESKLTSPQAEMGRPYARIVVLHISIIFGMFLIMLMGSPTFLVVLFVIFKTILDATIHSYSHRKKTAGSAETVVH